MTYGKVKGMYLMKVILVSGLKLKPLIEDLRP
jgi:hypothetical protein